MGASASPFDDSALPFRVWTLEHNQTRVEDKLSRVDDTVGEVKVEQATAHERVDNLVVSMTRLQGSLDKVFWALVTLLVTIIGAVVAVAAGVG